MASSPVRWSDQADDAIKGDLVAAAAYITPAGGAVVTGVAPCGFDRRNEGVLGFTTSLGLGKKLEHLTRHPQVALAFHTRQHGYSASPLFVLAQGMADIELRPSRQRLEAFIPQAERFMGRTRRGLLWDLLLREYYWERVFVDVRVHRLVTWSNLDARGEAVVSGLPLAMPAAPQREPTAGTGPRVPVDAAASQVAKLEHRLLAFRGEDGFPIIVPVELVGHDDAGLRITAADGLLPPGGRRAGLLAHAFYPEIAGLATRTLTGWLDCAGNGQAVYAPHTSKGYAAPPVKTLVLVFNGLLAKWGYRRALRQRLPERLERLARERGAE